MQIWPIGLLIVLMLVFFGLPVSAAVFPGSSGIPAPPTSQATYEDWLKATGKPVTSRYKGYKASFATWQTYRLLVYGVPAQVPGNRYDAKSAQYASLGYSYDEIEVTNSLFPDDSPDGKTRSSPWQWVELDMGQSARISWARLDARQKEFIKNSGLTYRNNSYGGMTFQSLKMTDKTTVVLAPPSWYLGFALYTNHYLPGSKTKLRYATFCGAGSGDVALAGRIDIINTAGADGKYIIDRGSDYIDISYNIVGSIASFNGLAASQDILYRGAGDSQVWVSGTGNGPWTAARTLRISRQDLAGLGERSFLLSGQAWVVSSMGDIKIINVEKTITVRAESQIPAFSANVQISGGIRYFSGQTNSQGRQMPHNPHRFLALERLKIIIDFNRDPLSISYTFNNRTTSITSVKGVSHYETSLIIPLLPSTISWDETRLKSALTLTVQATDRSAKPETISVSISDIELTGNIYDITYPQVKP